MGRILVRFMKIGILGRRVVVNNVFLFGSAAFVEKCRAEWFLVASLFMLVGLFEGPV
jgi:hypothetical protein